ncbi:MAG: TIM barrel protein, partial [Clostridia bacterium]|nr:TIM barrel protein [Clostridia bacterium]
MKLCFSTKHIELPSFLQLCRFAYDYGYAGFELYDPYKLRRQHTDSILLPGHRSDAARKLRNRGLSIPALGCSTPLEAASANELAKYVDMAFAAGIHRVIFFAKQEMAPEDVKALLGEAIARAEETNVELLIETSGPYADTARLLALFGCVASGCMGASWNVRETYFTAGESAETTIKTLGAYVRYVRFGDRLDGQDVLIGEGTLPVGLFLDALRSLHYEGYVCADWNDEVHDPDIVLTHFESMMRGFVSDADAVKALPTNRDGSGTFPFKKYEPVDLTFPEMLDVMVEHYPDQYAFKYTTLDYTRTYAQFRRDVDRTAAAFIAMGVKPGYHV